ncbi:MAG: hypothetical protein LBV61_07675 [Burkholderiaceae bacterium]|jgi:hypothetical protein|nr:hypothetical protein [Burkholderiaceae bacterium]
MDSATVKQAAKPQVEQDGAEDDQRLVQQRNTLWQEQHQSNGEMVGAVIAGFLLEHLDAYFEWIEGLNPSERRDCLRWIYDEQEKTRAAQRRLAWVATRDAQRVANAAERMEAAYIKANEERSRQREALWTQRKSSFSSR